MNYTARLSSSGQVTLPSALRQILGIKAGERVIFTKSVDGVITLSRQPSVEESWQDTLEGLQQMRDSLPAATKMRIKKNTGKTAATLRAEFDQSAAGKKHYKEKYDC